MSTRVVAVVTAGLSRPSSTRLLGEQLASATDRALRLRGERVELEFIELRELAHDLTNHLLTGFPGGDLASAIDRVVHADGLIAVTPIFSASYTGLFKTFFDVLEDGSLAGKPVLIAATAGTARHSLALEFAMRPLFAYLRATVAPTAVFAATEDFGGTGAGTTSLADRIDRAGRELADLVGSSGSMGATDPFESPTPFAELLAGR